MNSRLEEALDQCLVRLHDGESVESCLASYLEQAGELGPLLALAAAVQELPRPCARPRAVAAGLERMLAVPAPAAGLVSPSRRHFGERLRHTWVTVAAIFSGQGNLRRAPALRPLLAVLVVLVALFPLSIVASADSLPGDLLYPVKRSTEQVRLFFTIDDVERQALQEQYAQERRAEVRAVARLGRQVTVEIEGPVEAISAGRWLVDGFDITITKETVWEGRPRVGLSVYARVQVQPDGTLVALLLSADETAEPAAPTVLPTPTPSYPALAPGLPTVSLTSTCAPVAPTQVQERGSPTATVPSLPATRSVPSATPSPTYPEPLPTSTPTCTLPTRLSPSRTATPTHLPPSPTPTCTTMPTRLPPSLTRTATPTFRLPTPTSTGTATSTPRLPSPTSTRTATSTPRSPIPTSTRTATSTPRPPTPTTRPPTPTSTPTPTPMPTTTPTNLVPPTISIDGRVEAISDFAITVSYQGARYDATITPDTIIVGRPVVGDTVHLEATQEPSGSWIATYIQVLSPPPPTSDSSEAEVFPGNTVAALVL